MQARRVRAVLLAVSLLLVMPAEGRRRAVSLKPPPPPLDIFSAAEPADVRTTHLALDLTLDFTKQQIRGSATHTITNLTGTERFVVDTRNLLIERITVDGIATTWSHAPVARNGRPLIIPIRAGTRQVRIDYSTIRDGAAQWLEPLETVGDVAPFMFTISQPDHAREWIPLQDTPGVRLTYEATVRVPAGLMAVMSARNGTVPNGSGVYHFDMPHPIPPYLIALAAGRLQFHALDERSGIYAEPELLADAVADLQYVPDMVDVAERILGPHPFERYDVLLVPPGFPAAGMENPMLNFLAARAASPANGEVPAMPSDLLAHELAHSWAGDATTCATWSDMWLNEGFATYYAKRILEEMVSPERSELGFYWERQNYATIVELLPDESEILHREFAPGDTLSVFGTTNYAKGAMFLEMLEQRLGRARFDAIVREWFQRHRWKQVDAGAFVALLYENDVDVDALLVEEWLHAPGLPANVTAPTRSAIWDRIGVEAARFRAGTSAGDLDTIGWRDFEIGIFLWQISDVIADRMPELDAAFDLSSMKTPSMHWFAAVVKTFYPPAMPRFEDFLINGGPSVLFLYQELAKTPAGRTWAREFYQRVRQHYPSSLRQNIQRVLGIPGAASTSAHTISMRRAPAIITSARAA